MTEQTETIVYYGSEVKALGNGRLGGYLVLFGDEDRKDLEGDYFTQDTDYGAHKTSMVFYQHGLDKTLMRRVLDPAATLEIKDAGVWIETQLALRDAYEQALYDMAEAGKLGWSSGTASHLVDRKDSGHITRWPLGLDASLTPTPAEPRTHALPLKSIEIEPLIVDDKPETGGKSVEPNRHDVNVNISVKTETEKMDEKEVVAEAKEETPAFVTQDQFGELAANVTKMMQYITNTPKLKDAGYIAPDDEATRPEVKSFGDFLVAVGRGNHTRLAKVYKSTKDLSGEQGTLGGYLVPEEFATTLLQIAEQQSQILQRVTRVPVSSDSGRWPALDYSVTGTAGDGGTAMASGLTATTTAAGATLTETTPSLEQLQWRVNKVGGFTQVENELVADSPQAIEALLTNLFGIAIRSRTEHYILRGTGAGEPEGILNAPAAIAVTTATNNVFAWADATTMFSRFKPLVGNPVWIIHPGVWPDIGDFETSNGGGVFQANMQEGLGRTLLGYPILQSEHMPQDDNDDVILADLGSYLLFERSGLSISFSEHFAFTSDIGTYRFYQRLDGMSWLSSAITLRDPQGAYTVSPFVYHDD